LRFSAPVVEKIPMKRSMSSTCTRRSSTRRDAHRTRHASPSSTPVRDWDKTADDAVAVLHGEAGRNPYDRDPTELIGELSTQSEAFRARWARHDVRYHDTGIKRIHHPSVGDLDLTYEVMKLAADQALTMFVYTADPGSKSDESLRLLASWTATLDEPVAADPPDRD
jgi:MmyB-like transcription regulator ligand binding domain